MHYTELTYPAAYVSIISWSNLRDPETPHIITSKNYVIIGKTY